MPGRYRSNGVSVGVSGSAGGGGERLSSMLVEEAPGLAQPGAKANRDAMATSRIREKIRGRFMRHLLARAEVGIGGVSPDRAGRAGHSGSAARPRGVAGFFRPLPHIPEKYAQRQDFRRFKEALIHNRTTDKRKIWILLSCP